MKDFSKQVIATWLGSLLALGAGSILLFLLLIALGMVSASNEMPRPLKEATVLTIDLGMNLRDAPPVNMDAGMLLEQLMGRGEESAYLLETLNTIKRASKDPMIKAIYLHGSFQASGYGSGYAALREFRDVLIEFRNSGKPVIGFARQAMMKDYYVLSAASELYIHPQGALDLSGFSAQLTFFGAALEKYGVGVQVIRSGDYKSYFETFTRSDLSEENREQLLSLTSSLWKSYTDVVGENRGLPASAVIKASNEFGLLNADEALEGGFADASEYKDEIVKRLKELVGEDGETESFRQTDLYSYAALDFASMSSRSGNGGIGVVYAEGAIMDGVSAPDVIGADTVAKAIRDYRLDSDIKGIVLRVNSPGGGVLASEQIQREVKLAAEAKLLYVSFGSYAASGGYWISTHADRIFAMRETVTGSIGVIGMIPDFERIGSDVGISWDGVKTSEFADIFTVSRPKSENEIAVFTKFIKSYYDDFLKRVSEGRKLPIEKVQKLARGRVWSGEQAHERELVDEYGGLLATIDAVAREAGLSGNYPLHENPSRKTFQEQVEELLEGDREPIVESIYAVNGSPYDRVFEEMKVMMRALNDPLGVYARLPWFFVVE